MGLVRGWKLFRNVRTFDFNVKESIYQVYRYLCLPPVAHGYVLLKKEFSIRNLVVGTETIPGVHTHHEKDTSRRTR